MKKTQPTTPQLKTRTQLLQEMTNNVLISMIGTETSKKAYQKLVGSLSGRNLSKEDLEMKKYYEDLIETQDNSMKLLQLQAEVLAEELDLAIRADIEMEEKTEAMLEDLSNGNKKNKTRSS